MSLLPPWGEEAFRRPLDPIPKVEEQQDLLPCALQSQQSQLGALGRLWVPEGHTEDTSSSSELSRGVQGAEPAPGSDISKQDRLGMFQQSFFPPQQMSAPLNQQLLLTALLSL